ncbi:MAG: hypothetical protein U0Q12_22475 [Vicinamibacterales bacterium]
MRAFMMTTGLVVWVTAATAQAQTTRQLPTLELSGGYVGFGDEGLIHHTLAGAGLYWTLLPRLVVGPQIAYLIGPDADRDVVALGDVAVLLRRPRGAGSVVPFVAGGIGMMSHRDLVAGVTASSESLAFSFGGGVRTWVNDRVYVATEFRMGWEPHVRLTGQVGVALGR